jgi:alkylhydroperoxidase family enzyme
VLRSQFLAGSQVEAVVRDYRSAGLSPDEVAILAFTEKVTLEAPRVTAADVEELRRHGLSDAEILDVAMAAGARSFFSRVLDAVGAEPDSRYDGLETTLRDALVVGRRPESGG